MQKRNFISQSIVITLITCFLLLSQPLGENQLFRSNAWAGKTEWSDAFGNNSQGSNNNSRTKPNSSKNNWDTGFDKRDQYEQPNSYQKNENENTTQPQVQEKSVQTNTNQDSATTAEELLRLFNLPAIIKNTSEKSIDLLIVQSPDAKEYADIFREFGKIYLTWENLKKPIIKRYVETFSDQELQQLKTFFSSGAGKKYIQKSEALMQETTQDIYETILTYHEELKRMIVEKELAQFKKQN